MLEVKGLVKKLGTFQLGPINFVLNNEVLVILGENGAGKTTLLNIISGIIQTDSSCIHLNGKNLDSIPIEKRNVGYVFQKPYLFPHMKIYENITYGLSKKESLVLVDEKIKNIISLLGIELLMERPIHKLSCGEQQKVALARTLVTQPQILLLDEPLSQVDSIMKRKLRLEFAKLFSNLEIPVIYVTHDIKEVLDIADRILILNSGKIVEEGTKNEVLKYPKSEYMKNMISDL